MSVGKELFLDRAFLIFINFVLVLLAWVFFRANSASDAFKILGKIFTNPGIPFNESKSKMKVNGIETEYISYRPSIGWTDNINSKMEAWGLDYRNIWRPMFKMNNKTSISISATVKY